ncbi:MAG: beta-propeller domain-containing protein [Methanomassiliicoccales archaeon]|nr:beta-propeller domain-containing protein [Methanomassiliicoccales archaeon]
MVGTPVLKRLLAFGLVAALIATSLVMIFTPSIEELPEGDLPTFVSEAQLRNFLNERGGHQGNQSGMDAETGANYYSQTNVQVSGVDELDIVKSDGELLYVSNSLGVTIIKATPAGSISNASNLSVADLLGAEDANGYVQGLFIHDNILAVVVVEYDYSDIPYDFYNFSYYPINNEYVTCCLLDMTDPYSPQVLNRYSLSGYFVGARMIGDNMYLLGQESAWSMGEIALPQTGVDGDLKEVEATSIRFDPQSDDAGSFLNIMALDLVTFDSNFTSLLTGYSSVLYVSHENMYLTYPGYGEGSSGDTVFAKNSVVTTIFRLNMDGIEVVPRAKGYVEGYPLNQFSLDELDGVLRMAVSTGWSDGETRVYTLDQDLHVIGSLNGIAPGESMQSSRFMGTTLYLVTFLNTDPLFIIDLSDPASPEIIGEIVVPGFSTYLHPCSPELLAGIGLENWTLKISLFNVSDPASPEEIDTIIAPTNTWSDSLWEHKAVLFDGRDGLLFIPVFGWNEYTYEAWQMVYVIQVSDDGLTLRSNVTVGESYGQVRCSIIDDVLYTITSTDVTAWNMGSWTMLDTLTYCSGTSTPGLIYGVEER